MPCPYFEPLRPVETPQHTNARLPLLQEFDGLCRARLTPEVVPGAMRFRFCNQGNSQRECQNYPINRPSASIRFDVLRHSGASIEILMLEEREYAPFAWQRITYQFEGDKLEPETDDPSRRAQILAFCRTFAHQTGSRF